VLGVVVQVLFAVEILDPRSRFLEDEPPLPCLTQNVSWVVLPPLELVSIDTGRIIDDHARLSVSLPEASTVSLFERIDVGDSIASGRRDLPLGETGCSEGGSVRQER